MHIHKNGFEKISALYNEILKSREHNKVLLNDFYSIQQSPLRLKISIDALCKDFRLISHLERENEQQKNS
jgi:hypothetical protein